jgi:zinc D-Ala-D-Ala carboxypeptidase
MTDLAVRLSPHFTLSELTRSQTALRLGLDNVAGHDVETELRRLCDWLLEPVRELLGVPLHVDSGYRSLLVNQAVGGAVASAHLFGRAADVVPVGVSLTDAFDRVRRSALPYDQAIVECGAWLHLAIAPAGFTPRRQALTASGGPGRWTYTAVPA